MVAIVLDLEGDLEKSQHPLFVQEHKEFLLAGEILDPHLKTEVDLDLHQSQKYVQTVITDNISCSTHEFPLRKLNARLTVLQFIVKHTATTNYI